MHVYIAVLCTSGNLVAKSREKIRTLQITFAVGHGITCNTGARYMLVSNDYYLFTCVFKRGL